MGLALLTKTWFRSEVGIRAFFPLLLIASNQNGILIVHNDSTIAQLGRGVGQRQVDSAVGIVYSKLNLV